jgi:hypothetical protein
MTPRDPNAPSDTDAEVDPGEPITELADLKESPSEEFASRVLDGVNRRMLAADTVESSWWGITKLFLEYFQMLLRSLGIRDTEDEEDRVDG